MNWIKQTERIDWWRLLKLFFALVVSVVIGYCFHPMVSNNPDAINTVVTIFSILAGFLIAAITFIAEPTLRQAKGWEELQHMKKTVRRKLSRQKYLFFLYLLTLGLALAMYLTPPEAGCLPYLQAFFLGLTTFVFLASLCLPGSLVRIQMERYDAALEASRPKVVKKAMDAAARSKKKNGKGADPFA